MRHKFVGIQHTVQNSDETCELTSNERLPVIIHHSYVSTINHAFNSPCGVAVDSNFTLYVSDTSNFRIRKISLNGEIFTLSGNGIAGFRDGIGTNVQFQSPQKMAIDKYGNIIIADTFSHSIRLMNPNGEVKTLAGNNRIGFRDGFNALFNHPRGVAVDLQGNIIVADTENNKIRKIQPDGFVTTIAGDGLRGYKDGNTLKSQFNLPYGVTVNITGDIYVADTHNHSIRKISPNGVVSTVAGDFPKNRGFVDGNGHLARFSSPQAISNDLYGNIYVADTENNRIRKIFPNGDVITLIGKFNYPRAITVDSYCNIIVADTNYNRIKKIIPIDIIAHYWPKTHYLLNLYCRNAILEFLCISKQLLLYNETTVLPLEMCSEIVKYIIKLFFF